MHIWGHRNAGKMVFLNEPFKGRGIQTAAVHSLLDIAGFFSFSHLLF